MVRQGFDGLAGVLSLSLVLGQELGRARREVVLEPRPLLEHRLLERAQVLALYAQGRELAIVAGGGRHPERDQDKEQQLRADPEQQTREDSLAHRLCAKR